MSWLRQLRIYLGYDEPSPEPPNADNKEAMSALENAKAALGEAQDRRAQVHEVSSSLASLRARNHFGESIELAMSPRRER